MSEQRKPVFSFLLQITGKKGVKIEFFDAGIFRGATDEPTTGRYRLRIAGRWYCLNNTAKHEYFFTDVMTAWEIIRREFGLGPGMPPPEVDPSRFPKGCRVRAKVKGGGYAKTFTASEPFKDTAGTWRVYVGASYSLARNPDALECLELLK